MFGKANKISFVNFVRSRHAMEERSALRDDPSIAAKNTIIYSMCGNNEDYFCLQLFRTSENKQQNTCAWVYFIQVRKVFFLSPWNDIFVGIFWKLMLFFFPKIEGTN